MTSQKMKIKGCTVAHSLDDAILAAGETEELMVMGGAHIYKLALPRANRLYITQIHAAFEGDTYFPPFDMSAWRETFCERHNPDEKNRYPYTFLILDRGGKHELAVVRC